MMDSSRCRIGAEAGAELHQPLPMPSDLRQGRGLQDSSKIERKTRVRSIKFDLDGDQGKQQPTSKLNRTKSKSESDLVSILKKKKERRSSDGATKKPRRGLRKTAGSQQSLHRMSDAVTTKKDFMKTEKTKSKKNDTFSLTDHMLNLKKKQNRGLRSVASFHDSEPNFAPLSLEDFDKGGTRNRRRSARGKTVPIQRRSYPSTRFCEKELPPLVPYPSEPLLKSLCGRLSPVYFEDLDAIGNRSDSVLMVSKGLDVSAEMYQIRTRGSPELNGNTATSA